MQLCTGSGVLGSCPSWAQAREKACLRILSLGILGSWSLEFWDVRNQGAQRTSESSLGGPRELGSSLPGCSLGCAPTGALSGLREPGSLWSREADQPWTPERLGSKAAELGEKQAQGGEAASAEGAKGTKTGKRGRAGEGGAGSTGRQPQRAGWAGPWRQEEDEKGHQHRGVAALRQQDRSP